MLFVGDDWAEDHHDVFLMNETGDRLASRRLPEGLAGISRLHELIAEHAEDPAQVVICIETDRGLWVDALTAAGCQVFAINEDDGTTDKGEATDDGTEDEGATTDDDVTTDPAGTTNDGT